MSTRTRSTGATQEDFAQQLAQERSRSDALQAHVSQLQAQLEQRKVAEDRLRSALAELERANQGIRESHRQLLYAEKMAVLGALVAGIAHEIKTPVGAINSMQDTLVRALDKLKHCLGQSCPTLYAQNKQLRAAVSAIEDANKVIASGSSRVLEIVSRLRSFARMDACERRDIDLHAGLEDTLLLLHHELKNRIKVERHYGELPPIQGNAGQINQVLLNVLVNAVQAIAGKGTIAITTGAEADDVLISISDDGAGIPAENMDRIFEPGFTTKSVGVGTGLGLAICHKIVNEHQGRIDLRSQVGKGTQVTIRLPQNPPLAQRPCEECCPPDTPPQQDD